MTGNAGALFNMVLGAACIAGGASGRMALFGTGSSGALVLAGVVAVGLGVFQLWRRQAR